jgi:glycosyltransferase involved in cell wall biosynthesis
MNFSVCLIAKNEEKTLPRMGASLKEFRERGGEMLLLDTGSTDKTVEVAESLGFKVFEVGDKFVKKISKTLANNINKKFNGGDQPIVSESDKIFNFSAARNYIAEKAANDMIAMPDCDEEYTAFDLDRICEAIEKGGDQLEYNFVYSHDEYGNEAIKFTHCKFYNRTKLNWVGVVHEVLQGKAERVFLGEDIIKLEHFQNQESDRSQYLTGLALDCFLNPENDRNSHYLGREFLYTGRYKSAIKELKRHLTLGTWKAERSQSMIFIGDSYMALGDEENALLWWHKAYDEEPSRREPFVRLAWNAFTKGEAQRVVAFCEAMLTIPWSAFYANNRHHYTVFPHELLYWAYWQLGDQISAKMHFNAAIRHDPKNKKFLEDFKYFNREPKVWPSVSIVIPTLGRKKKLKRLLDAIEENAGYENYEVIVAHDGEDHNEEDFYSERVTVLQSENRQGVPVTVKQAVEKSQGSLVMFLGNDCIPKENFLKNAVQKMFDSWGLLFDGLVGLNDGYWRGEIATHWLASKALLPYLDGEFFHTGYNHVGCDNELTARCKKIGKYVWAEEAEVFHEHPIQDNSLQDEIYKLGLSKQDKDRKLLKKRSEDLEFELLENFIRP